ncbi:MAG: hypothetical protein WCZ89_08245 [Phycisphaerae bacterium]
MLKKRAKNGHGQTKIELPKQPQADDKIVVWAEMVFLAAIGLLYSLHFLQHFVFPNSDFVSFLETGRKWLSFETPDVMKRAPLFSIITALLAEIFNYPGGSLLGTGIYNAIMLPVAMVLIYLIAKQFLGKAAVWTALLAGITPMMVYQSSDLLAEMTLIVLLAATAIAVGKNTRWAYVFAMLGSIARWDLVPLLAIVPLLDFIRTRKWLKPVLYTAAASIPFAFCMLITLSKYQAQISGEHYLYILSDERSFELLKDLSFYSQIICSFFLAPILTVSNTSQAVPFEALNSAIYISCSTILAVTVLGGILLAFLKKQWALITLILAAIPYIAVHSFYPFHIMRFSVPFAWVGLLLAAYSLIIFWQWFRSLKKPIFIEPALKILGAILFAVWAVKIYETLGYANKQCPIILRLAIISCIVIIFSFFILEFLRRAKPSLSWLTIPSFFLLAVFSNASSTGFLMRDGQNDASFKQLMINFRTYAKPSDKLLTTMAGFGPVFTNLPQDRFVHISLISPDEAKDFDEFIAKCRELGVTLIAWDSRLYNKVNDRYHKIWGMDRWDALSAPYLGQRVTRIGPCVLVDVIADRWPVILVYRIMPE